MLATALLPFFQEQDKSYQMNQIKVYYICSILGPDSLKNFQGTCKRNFLCLQMISFEFLRAASIG